MIAHCKKFLKVQYLHMQIQQTRHRRGAVSFTAKRLWVQFPSPQQGFRTFSRKVPMMCEIILLASASKCISNTLETTTFIFIADRTREWTADCLP